jgi:hypothetical protein
MRRVIFATLFKAIYVWVWGREYPLQEARTGIANDD